MGSSNSRREAVSTSEARSGNGRSVRGMQSNGHGHHERVRVGTATLNRIRQLNHRIYRTAHGATEVNCCVKYCVFTVNFVLFVLSALVAGAGIWAFNEKTGSFTVESLSNVAFDPAAILILVGAISTFVTFCAWFGALRENTALLATFIATISVALFAQVACGICVGVYRERIETEARSGLMRLITLYRDDLDLRDLIDALQYALACCGVLSVDDWDANVYFNCSSPSIEACGVPPSCCIVHPLASSSAVSSGAEDAADGESKPPSINLQCGYKTRKRDRGTGSAPWSSTADDSAAQTEIQRTGCYTASTQWIVTNQAALVAVAVTLGIVQVLAICFAASLRADILAARRRFNRETREHREIMREQRELQAAIEESAQQAAEQQQAAANMPMPSLNGPVFLVPAGMVQPALVTTNNL